MKRQTLTVFILVAIYSFIYGGTIEVTFPKGGETLNPSKSVDITWTSFGVTNNVKISLWKGGSLFGVIASSVSNTGSYNWKKVGQTLKGIAPEGKDYIIKIKEKTTNVIGKSTKTFSIGTSSNVLTLANPGSSKNSRTQPIISSSVNLNLTNQNIIIHTPKAGHFWKPLSTYTIAWEAFSDKFPKSAYSFNVKLLSADGKPFTPLFLKKNYWQPSKHNQKSEIYSIEWEFLPSMNIPSGKYKVLVQSVSILEFKAKTGAFTVENSISSGTASLGFDEPDFKIEDVYYDTFKKSIWVRIKNQGMDNYNGPLSIDYSFELDVITYNNPTCKKGTFKNKVEFKQISLGKFQSKAFQICQWTCFDKRPADYLPITGPVKYTVSVFGSGNKAVTDSGILCKCQKPDIILTGFSLINKYNPVSILRFQKKTLNPSSFNWISKTTFTAKVSVNVKNWGCQAKQFDIKMHMNGNYLNDLKAVKLGTIHLAPGQEKVYTSKTIKFSIPKDNKYHKLLVVAYQPEKNNQGYPNAYMNNFMLIHVRLKPTSNTVRGFVSP